MCKLTAGRLRPHFLTVCHAGLVECGTWASPSYVTNYTCAGDSQLFPDEEVRNHRVREARLSFLSGHASLATYGMLYSIMFIQTRTRSSQAFRLVRGLLQVRQSPVFRTILASGHSSIPEPPTWKLV